MKGFKNMAFWKKLVFVAIIPLLIISVLIGFLSYHRSRLSAEEAGKNNISDAVNRIDHSVTLRARQIDQMLRMMALFYDCPERISSDGFNRMLDQYGGLVKPFQEIVSISLIDGENLIASSDPGLNLDREVVQSLYSALPDWNRKSRWTGPVIKISELTQKEKPYFMLAHGIGNLEGESLGLLLFKIDAHTMGDLLLQKQDIVAAQTSFLMDNQGRIFYGKTSIPDALLELIKKSYGDGSRAFDVVYDGKRVHCVSQYNAITGWTTCTVIKQEDLFVGSSALRDYIKVLVTTCILVAFVLILLVSRMITRPLADLNKAMEQVQSGDFDVHLDNDRSDEIGDLTDRFNYMVDEINRLVNRVYVEQLLQKVAEMKALQAQINPHFLYNSLDSINWMLIERGEIEISRVVVSLGKMMQYSMNTAVSVVSLMEEYQNAGDYLLIQKNRLEDQLDYDLYLDPGLENFRIPKLILQPLIENSIKHGILESKQPGYIKVSAYCEGGYVVIRVADNGIGMTLEKRDRVLNNMNKSSSDGSGLGIFNVARRLQLHFNDQCTFKVESALGKGTSISLFLPAK